MGCSEARRAAAPFLLVSNSLNLRARGALRRCAATSALPGCSNSATRIARWRQRRHVNGNHCAHGQRVFAQDIGYGVQSTQMAWRCYAANSTNANRPGGRFYCSRGTELCSCRPVHCHVTPPPLPPPPLPLPHGGADLFGFEQSSENRNACRYAHFARSSARRTLDFVLVVCARGPRRGRRAGGSRVATGVQCLGA